MLQVRVPGIDIAKQVFYVVGMDESGRVVLRKRLARGARMPLMTRMPPVVIGMEACGGAYDRARRKMSNPLANRTRTTWQTPKPLAKRCRRSRSSCSGTPRSSKTSALIDEMLRQSAAAR
jgi:hypothetical protein